MKKQKMFAFIAKKLLLGDVLLHLEENTTLHISIVSFVKSNWMVLLEGTRNEMKKHTAPVAILNYFHKIWIY
jgi:hypothetical protein